MLTIQYFNYAARAQAAELQLRAGMVPYVRMAVAKSCKKTPAPPFESLPALYVQGQNVLCGAPVVERFCAQASGNLPSYAFARARAEMIMDECHGVLCKMEECNASRNKGKAWDKFDGEYLPARLSQFFDYFDDDFYGGCMPNAADVSLFSILNLMRRAGISWEETCPEFEDFYASVASVGHISRYLSDEPPLHFVRIYP